MAVPVRVDRMAVRIGSDVGGRGFRTTRLRSGLDGVGRVERAGVVTRGRRGWRGSRRRLGWQSRSGLTAWRCASGAMWVGAGSGRLGLRSGLDGVGRVERAGVVPRERRGRARVPDDSGCALGSTVWAGLNGRALCVGGDAGGRGFRTTRAAQWARRCGPGWAGGRCASGTMRAGADHGAGWDGQSRFRSAGRCGPGVGVENIVADSPATGAVEG
jgi:hypothetical protein